MEFELSDEERKAIEYWKYIRDTQIYDGYRGQTYAVTLLNLIEKQANEIESLKEDNEKWKTIFDIGNKRKYKSKYLEEKRKENNDLLYPDSDEIYREYYQQKDLIEKQSKELEELREDNQRYKRIANQKFDDIENFKKNECEHRCIKNAEVLELKEYYKENYISKEESEQKEKEAYIKGSNITNELCNKKWKDKIEAKIEKIDLQGEIGYLVNGTLLSLLEED